MRLISEGKSTIELLSHAGKTDSSLERNMQTPLSL